MRLVLCVSALMAVLCAGNQGRAQAVPPQQSPDLPNAPLPTQTGGSAYTPVSVKGFPVRVLRDEVRAVTSPLAIRTRDLKWLLPLTGATAAAFSTDERTMSQVVSSNPSFNNTAVNVSDTLVSGFIAAPVALFAVGSARHNDRARETGILGGEAMTDAYLLGGLIKLCAFRERPPNDHSEGDFFVFSSGASSSFVSQHSLVAWSSAAVLAGEYPNRWMQTGVYTLATGVSLTRVLGQEHFPSDVLLGSTVGWLVGHYVYGAHHHEKHLPSHIHVQKAH